MNMTSNYGLNQWQQADRLMMEDFNADNAKTEQALAELAGSVAELAAKQHLKLDVTTYTGNGKYGNNNPTTIAFAHMPLFFVVFGNYDVMVGTGGVATAPIIYSDSGGRIGKANLTWNGNQFSFHTNSSLSQLNLNNTYYVVSFYME